MRRLPQAPAGRAGFTLIEVLAVLLIIGILFVALLVTLGGQGDVVDERLTRTRLEQITLVVDQYERAQGAYPPSRFTGDQGTMPNSTNVGAEALVVALWSDGYEAGGDLDPDGMLGNLDTDRSAKPLTDFGHTELLELIDEWDNPIAYLHHMDYGERHAYVTYDGETGELVESEVQALKDDVTRRFQRHARFQLISAGLDGRFGTEDDIANFDR